MKKIIVTGASGFLGSRVVQHFNETCQVVALTHQSFDVSNEKNVMETFGEVMPDAVIHCAALADTGYCQNNPSESFRVNVLGTEIVAKTCQRIGAKLVYMSSDQVYTGVQTDAPQSEKNELAPINVYGQHKLEAEQRVAEVMPNAVGLRLTWMCDRLDSVLKLNRNVLTNLQMAVQTGVPLKAALGEHRGITNVWEVVRNFEKTFDLSGGIYNYGAENSLSTYDTLCLLARTIYGLQAERLVLCDKTWRRNLAMDTLKIQQGGISFKTTVESVLTCLNN